MHSKYLEPISYYIDIVHMFVHTLSLYTWDNYRAVLSVFSLIYLLIWWLSLISQYKNIQNVVYAYIVKIFILSSCFKTWA